MGFFNFLVYTWDISANIIRICLILMFPPHHENMNIYFKWFIVNLLFVYLAIPNSHERGIHNALVNTVTTEKLLNNQVYTYFTACHFFLPFHHSCHQIIERE